MSISPSIPVWKGPGPSPAPFLPDGTPDYATAIHQLDEEHRKAMSECGRQSLRAEEIIAAMVGFALGSLFVCLMVALSRC